MLENHMSESKQERSGPDGNFKLHQGETGTFPIYFAIPADSTGLVRFSASVLNLAGIARPDISVRLLHERVTFPPGSLGYAQVVVTMGEDASPVPYFVCVDADFEYEYDDDDAGDDAPPPAHVAAHEGIPALPAGSFASTLVPPVTLPAPVPPQAAVSAAPPHAADAAVHTAPVGTEQKATLSTDETPSATPAPKAPSAPAPPKSPVVPDNPDGTLHLVADTKPHGIFDGISRQVKRILPAVTSAAKEIPADIAAGSQQAATDLAKGAKRVGSDLLDGIHAMHTDPIGGAVFGGIPDLKGEMLKAADAGASSAVKPGWKKIAGVAGDVVGTALGVVATKAAVAEAALDAAVAGLSKEAIPVAKAAIRAGVVSIKKVEQVFDAFDGVPKLETLKEDVLVYRRFSDPMYKRGQWVSQTRYSSPEDAIRFSALPSTNKASEEAAFTLSKGATVIVGKAKSMAGKPGFGRTASGGGDQIFVSDPRALKEIK